MNWYKVSRASESAGIVSRKAEQDGKSMTKLLLAVICAVCIAGCYTVNNERFAGHVQTLVEPGIKMDTATRRLEADGFSCGPAAPTPSRTCAKTRQRLIPSTCIERVNLYTSGNSAIVERIEVPHIVCAGF
jgi:hypothetical protein